MKLTLIKPKESMQYDITNAIQSVEWSGSVISACRTLDFAYVNAPYDPTVVLPVISSGDFVSFEDNGTELYYGQIFGIERSTETGTITYTSNDMIKNLLESKGKYNFKNMTPEAIAAQVLNDIQVPFNHLAPTGINIKSMLCDDQNYYDIILGAYTQAYRMTGKRYLPMIWQRAFGVWEAVYTVGNFVISDELNLTSASITEKMDAIRNLIKIYDDSGKQVGEVVDQESRSAYGTFQRTYVVEDGVDPYAAAQNMLAVAPTQTIDVEVIGDNNCLSGYSVAVRDAATGVSGKYWIKSDRHRWENGTYMMTLELSFEQLMDEKEIQEEEPM